MRDERCTCACAADDCPAPAVYRSGGGWICAAHRDAQPERWAAVTVWQRTHRWAYRAAAFAERLSSLEWVAQADKAAAFCVRRNRPEWGPRIDRIEQRVFDRTSGSAIVTVRELDERKRGRAWAYRLRRELLAECLPAKDAGEAGGQRIELGTPKTAASLAKAATESLRQREQAVSCVARKAAGRALVPAGNSSEKPGKPGAES